MWLHSRNVHYFAIGINYRLFYYVQKKGAGLAVVEPQARSSQADLQTEGWQPNSQKDKSSVGWGGGKSSPNPLRWSKEQNNNKNNYNNEKENYF